MRSIAPSPPRDYDALKGLLLARREELPRRLVQVAAFALENPDEIAFGTVASVAAQADVQPSTLIRFAQTLGYAGFSDLQEVFRAQLKSRWPDYRERLARLGAGEDDEREDAGDLLNGFAESAIASIERASPHDRRCRPRSPPPRSWRAPTPSFSSAFAAPSRSPPTSPTRSASSACGRCSSTRSPISPRSRSAAPTAATRWSR